jgi:hypothetical protein
VPGTTRSNLGSKLRASRLGPASCDWRDDDSTCLMQAPVRAWAKNPADRHDSIISVAQRLLAQPAGNTGHCLKMGAVARGFGTPTGEGRLAQVPLDES